MKRLHLTSEDMADLIAGRTINAMIEGGEELATSAAPPNWDWTGPAREPDQRPRQDANGFGYLGYFSAPWGFCWSGHQEHLVEVTQGGMGEPVVATFHLAVASGKPADITERFKNACEQWIEGNVTNELFGVPITPSIIITAKED